MMRESILSFARQFSFEPEVKNAEKLGEVTRVVLGGMGGSHLAAGLMKACKPGIELYVHRDYGIPPFDDSFCKGALFLASSYSGNTEETIDFAKSALAKGYRVAVMTTGGALGTWAEENDLPFVQIPRDGIQPRIAIGYALVGIAKVLGDASFLSDIRLWAETFDPSQYEEAGEQLAGELEGSVPVVYASHMNLSLAYNWKIKFNETAKIPAFYNLFPELNHNEMTGFDVAASTKKLSDTLRVLMLEDSEDDARIQKRMQVTKALYEERGIKVSSVQLAGKSKFDRIFGSLITADWTALALADRAGVEAEQVPMVEDFKRRIT